MPREKALSWFAKFAKKFCYASWENFLLKYVATGEAQGGQIIVCPTDTLYALVADTQNSTAMDRIYVIKGRSITQSLPLIAADLEQVNEQFGPLSKLGTRLASTFWPGPLTLIVQANAALGNQCKATDGSVAVRVP